MQTAGIIPAAFKSGTGNMLTYRLTVMRKQTWFKNHRQEWNSFPHCSTLRQDRTFNHDVRLIAVREQALQANAYCIHVPNLDIYK